MKKINSLILSTVTAAFLIGCGGGGGSSSSSGTTTASNSTTTTSTGTLIDNTISGVKYINGSTTGYTNANGNFIYTSGKVEFYLGGIKLGELSSMTSDNKIFIQDLVGVARDNITDAKVLKIGTLLQSLDSDSTTDEIEIKLADFEKFANINTSLDELDVSTVLTENSFTAKTEEKVKAHMENTLKEHGVIYDTTAPEINQDSVKKDADGHIYFSFTETIPMKYLTNEYITLKNNSDNSNIDITITYKDGIVTLVPNTLLTSDNSYSVIISSKVKDFAGNGLLNQGSSIDSTIDFLSIPKFVSSYLSINVTDIKPSPGNIVDNSYNTSIFVNPNIVTELPSYTISKDENINFSITIKVAMDNMRYEIDGIDSNYFSIDPNTGTITFKTTPDYETKNSYSITIKAIDSTKKYIIKENIIVNINDVAEAFQSGDIWKGLVYETITSPYTGRIWLDRNLGATEVCTSLNDKNCYGDYYQWGRNVDGHEKISSIAMNDMLEKKDVLNVGHSYFIKDCVSGYCNYTINDWTNNLDDNGLLRNENWSKTDGSSICPVNFRVPTKEELANETTNQGVSNMNEAFLNFLKIPTSSFRHQWLGYEYVNYPTYGSSSSNLWTTSTDSEFAYTGIAYKSGAFSLSINSSSSNIQGTHRAAGIPVRCIKAE